MCGTSEAKLGKFNVDIDLGYDGGRLQVGETFYENIEGFKDSPDEMIKLLEGFKKEELIQLLIDFIDNADED